MNKTLHAACLVLWSATSVMNELNPRSVWWVRISAIACVAMYAYLLGIAQSKDTHGA